MRGSRFGRFFLLASAALSAYATNLYAACDEPRSDEARPWAARWLDQPTPQRFVRKRSESLGWVRRAAAESGPNSVGSPPTKLLWLSLYHMG
jgi:hypothetical protein